MSERSSVARVVSQASTKDLNRVLGRKELMSVAIGQIIGAGIFAMAGIAIGITGKSVNLAFIMAAIAVIIFTLPMLIVGGTIRMRGGMYTQAALLVGEKFAGAFIIIHIFANLAIAMYAISFADYFLALVPGLNSKLIAVVILSVFYVTNLMGVKGAAKLQNIMVMVMTLALTAFLIYGVPQIKPGYFGGSDFMIGGLKGLFNATALLTFATGGANVIINLGAEAKNPTKDIPFVLIVSTVVVAAVYAFLATVAAGVLPISEVAFQPLSLVAKEIMPPQIYVFFIVGGAMFALATTLNATMGWVTKPLMQACVDGWLPKNLAVTSKKTKAPYILLTIFYIVGLFPLLTGWNISGIANFALILNFVLFGVLAVGTVRLPIILPELWEKSKFKTSQPVLWTISLAGGAVCLFQIYMLMMNLTTVELYANVGVLVLAVIFAVLRYKTGKVDMEISYEEA